MRKYGGDLASLQLIEHCMLFKEVRDYKNADNSNLVLENYHFILSNTWSQFKTKKEKRKKKKLSIFQQTAEHKVKTRNR